MLHLTPVTALGGLLMLHRTPVTAPVPPHKSFHACDHALLTHTLTRVQGQQGVAGVRVRAREPPPRHAPADPAVRLRPCVAHKSHHVSGCVCVCVCACVCVCVHACSLDYKICLLFLLVHCVSSE